jgi:hypothetical protein
MGLAQADLARNDLEPSVRHGVGEAGSPLGDEEAGTKGLWKDLVPEGGIVPQGLLAGAMEGHQSRFVAFGMLNGHQAVGEIHVFTIQTDGFADTHTRYRQQPDQGGTGSSFEGAIGINLAGRFHQPEDVRCPVKEGVSPTRWEGHQFQRGHFGSLVQRAHVLREATHKTQAFGLVLRHEVGRVGRPFHSQLGGDEGSALLLRESDEMA